MSETTTTTTVIEAPTSNDPGPEQILPAETGTQSLLNDIKSKRDEAAKELTREKEPEATPEKKPIDEMVSARYAKMVAKEKESRQKARLAEEERARLKAEAEREIQEAKAERDKWSKFREKPSAEVLQELGVDPVDFVEQFLQDGKPTPDRLFREMKKRDEELESIKKELEDLKRYRDEQDTERKRAESRAVYEKGTKEFVDMVHSSPEKYRHILTEYDEEEMIKHAIGLATEASGRKMMLTDEQIADLLEKHAMAIYNEKQERVSKYLQGAKGSDKKATSKGNNTLTNDLAASSAAEPSDLSLEERKKIAAKLLRT